MTMIEHSEHEILDAMSVYGGSFVKKLVELYHLADEDNRSIIRIAFNHYFVKYDEMLGIKKQST